jgi:hypothetical protein
MFISKKIKYFMMVAKELSIKVASEKLFLSAPPVSKGISDLEQFLGYKLFTRDKGRIILTKKGRELYSSMMPIVLELEDLESSYKHNDSKCLSLGMDGFYFHELSYLLRDIYTLSNKQVDAVSEPFIELKKKYESGDITVCINNETYDSECTLDGEFIDLGTDHIKIAVEKKLYQTTPDVNSLLKKMPLVQLSTALKHNYFKIVDDYRIKNCIKTPILSVPEIPNVTSLIKDQTGISFVSQTVKNTQNWENCGIILIDPPIQNLTVRRRIYFRSEESFLYEKMKPMNYGSIDSTVSN